MKVYAGRLTVVDTLYHEGEDGKAQSWGQPFSAPIISCERSYERLMSVTEDWQPVDVGWIGSPRMLRIENIYEKFTCNPTEQQIAEADSRIVELSNDVIVRPGESCRFEPKAPFSWRIRCSNGSCKVLIVATPR